MFERWNAWKYRKYRSIFRDANDPKNDSGTRRNSLPPSKDKRLSFRSVTFLISSCSYRTFQWERGEIFARNYRYKRLIISSATRFPRLHSYRFFYGSFGSSNFGGRTKFAFFLIYNYLILSNKTKTTIIISVGNPWI